MSTNPFHTPDYHGDIAPKGCVVQYPPEGKPVPRPGTSPARFYGPRVPGGEPWLQMDDGSWWKWTGSGWVSEAEVLESEARS